MTEPGKVEISGAGFAGLAAAAALARRGWRVRLHERYPSLRAEGFGITLFRNGTSVLKAIGAFEQGLRRANPIAGLDNLRPDGKITASHRVGGDSYRASRGDILEAMAARAVEAGAEIVFDSAGTSATPDGTLTLESGETRKADLVIVSDGVNSVIRDSLDLTASQFFLPSGAQRFLIPRLPSDFPNDSHGIVQEWWSGAMRVIYGACSPTETYIALNCRPDDARGRAIPVDVEYWSAAFPKLSQVFQRAHQTVDWKYVLWAHFQAIRLKSWSAGRVAVVGDAAHAMPPNLGQGGGCALVNALGLVAALEEAGDIGSALALWERRERPLTEHTQKWSLFYGRLAEWPAGLRSSALWTINRVPWLRRSYMKTQNHNPRGIHAPRARGDHKKAA